MNTNDPAAVVANHNEHAPSKASNNDMGSINEELFLVGPPCKLALAQGFTAVARIGGGQGNDDVYRSIMDWNHMEPREKKCNAIGGAEGMVGGGFWMGGGLGRGEERLYGCGMDQVLEIEMVLTDGKHVKFRPTEREVEEGFIYPKTTKVGRG